MLNDNERETREELEAANHALRTSLKKCEGLIEDFRARLWDAQNRLEEGDAERADRRQSYIR